MKRRKRPYRNERQAALAFYRVTADDLVAKLCDLTGDKPLSFTERRATNDSLSQMRLLQLGGTTENDKKLETFGYMILSSKFIQVLEGLMNGDELTFLRNSFEHSNTDPLDYLKKKGVTSAAQLATYYGALTRRIDLAALET